MKKIIKIIAGLFPVLTVTQSVTACTDKRIDVSDWLVDGNLGYVENLEQKTIIDSFTEKNPNTQKDVLSFLGNSYSGTLTVNPWLKSFYKGEIGINYHSKLAYKELGVDENIECQLNSFDDVCDVDLNILDPVNHPLSEEDNYKYFIHGSGFFNVEGPEIIEENQMLWHFSLKKENTSNLQDSYDIAFRWYDAFLFKLTILIGW
ncbi:hypothetical protein SSABA_v1c03700 [Spiroplasma sabaudiense Ar-1343]|uniref:Lipoprotein n=1 Tax=Spiroplasma sabaudiense Ar-1343 TaxID=1276257 RepID=W6AJ88_9MOLU|nr:hypothetical protein [Spiroplasma sabaudiense]AHI53779.1 hypothetical protein SSABA_v1c03700 [Spiroplasma sabaudiense Ar-1343]